MLAAMKDAPGVGLAAPQLGVPLRIIVFGDTENNARYLTKERDERGRVEVGPEVWINPSFKPVSQKKVKFFEGHLIVPGLQAMVECFEEVELRRLDEDGKEKEPLRLKGWPAGIVQDEIDHLDRILYVDCMECTLRASALNRGTQLLTRAKEAGVRPLGTQAAVLALPRAGEALAVKFEGDLAQSDQEGCDLKGD
ncbi:peptide deformylase [Bradyrhizobium yuanmingense]|uniref:peptide deformylase n=1 Tax=Bradyrhizobium yuanmingense TaxID=108015 RepID=UPI00135F48F0|nr:peptide deformylase [Bradyrhizobium yuanmingense]MVT55275.1 peptide deformylase [Bradyrhizobium yuanmingense]